MPWNDFRCALRVLTKRPAFTLVAVLTLAIGMGLNSTVFSFVNAVLLRGLPLDEGHRIMFVKNVDLERDDDHGISYLDLLDYREQATSFESLAAFRSGTMNLSDSTGVPERLFGSWVTANTFDLIRQQPVLGRTFSPSESDPGAEPVAILGFDLWQTRYGGRSDILGDVIRLNEIPTTVVGVMPQGMRFPENDDLWVALTPTARELEDRSHTNLAVFARLAEDTSLKQAQAEVATLSARFAERFPDSHGDFQIAVLPYNEEFNGGEIKILFLVLMAAVGFVLLIACANVANLLLARSSGRAREMSVRSAMGAGRRDIVRQLLAESMAMSLLGGVVGLAFSFWGVRMFELATASIDKPYWIDFTVDLKVVAFLALVCLVTTVLFGLAPALHASRIDLNTVLRDGGRGQGSGTRVKRATASLVIVQLAFTVVLLFGAGLMIKSFQNFRDLELGIRQDHVLTLRVGLPEATYPSAEGRIVFQQALSEEIRSLPGVEAEAITSHLPISGAFRMPIELADQPLTDGHEAPRVNGLVISPGYFSTLEVDVREGRAFNKFDGHPESELDDTELAGAGVVIVNQAFAAAHWPPGGAVGQRLRRVEQEKTSPWLTVVGVTADIRQNGPEDPHIEPTIYLPYRQEAPRFFSMLVRTSTEPESLSLPVQQAVQRIDRDLPVYSIESMEDFVHGRSWAFRVFGTLFGIFALIAVLLSSVGVYAVMSYAVSQRLQEIGVRMAVGAGGSRIVWLILRGGLRQLLIGLVLGVPAALVLGKVLQGLMVQVSPRDPWILAIVASTLGAAAVAACLVPAMRAVRVDPVHALRD